MPHSFFKTLPIIAACISGCSQYAVNLNGRNLYQPPQLFSDFNIGDPGLSQCVKRVILQKSITSAAAVTALACTASGVQTTEGIEVFTELTQIDLAYNQLDNLDGLLKLPKLASVNLEGNLKLPCSSVKALAAKGVSVTASQCPR